MKIIDKHLLRECLLPYFYCVFGMSMILVMSDLFERESQFRAVGTPIWDVVLFYIHYLAAYARGSTISSVVMILPISLLAGTLYSLTRLTRQNELTAMRASGVSLYRLMLPFLCLGVFSSLLGVAAQELVAPSATQWITRYDDLLEGRPIRADRTIRGFKYFDEASRALWEVGSFNLSHPEHLWDVRITIERDDRTRERRIVADRARWRSGKWWLSGISEQKYLTTDEMDGLPSEKIRGPIEMPELTGEPLVFVMEADSDTVEKYASSLVLLKYLEKPRGLPPVELARRRTDAHLRLAMPWVCVIASLIAIPAAARGGHRGAFSGANLAVIMFLAFYLAVQVSSVFAKRELISPWLSAWLPNIAFLGIGTGVASRMR
jgi:lipopolysaccharide export system permease protein